MSNWLEKIHGLSAGMLFTHGYVLPSTQDERVQETRTGQREPSEGVSIMQRCANVARAIAQRPRLIQPH